MKKIITIFSLVLLVGQIALAQTGEVKEEIASFQKVMSMPVSDIVVPTVIVVPLSEWVSPSEQFLVKENETGKYIGYYFDTDTSVLDSGSNVITQPSSQLAQKMIDGKRQTSVDFSLPAEGNGKVKIILNSSKLITTSQLNIQFDKYVSLPNTVEINYSPATKEMSLVKAVSQKRMTGNTVLFPEVSSRHFEITLTYSQPLRITEIDLVDKEALVEKNQTIRFLAQPNMSYEIYYDADRPVKVLTSESGNLRSDEGVLETSSLLVRNNSFYVPSDTDGDNVRDTLDNCVYVSNATQVDLDANGRGDACDDWDKDGVINSKDNCVNNPNYNQKDTDSDGIGDVCDGEESRFTEANPWVPWVGIGMSILVIFILFALVAKAPKREEESIEEKEVEE